MIKKQKKKSTGFHCSPVYMKKAFINVVQNADIISLLPGSGNWYWVANEEVEKLYNGEKNKAAVWKQCSEKEIIKPVEDIDKEECHGENSASVTINVVRIFHSKHRRCSAWCILHRRKATALSCHVLLWSSTVPSVTVSFVLCGLLCSGPDLQRLVWLFGGDDGDGAISTGFIELPQKILIDIWITMFSLSNIFKCFVI